MGLTTDILSYYQLDESTGDVIDSVASNDGTNTGATAGADGKIETAYSFVAANHIDFTKNSTLTNSFSFGGWFKPTADITIPAESLTGTGAGGGGFAFYAQQGTVDWGGDSVGVGLGLGTNCIFVGYHLSEVISSIATHTATLSGWEHIIVVIDNKTAKFI